MAMKRRAEGVTNVHSHSSRSHLVVAITVSSSMSSVSSTPMITPQGSPYKTTSNITVHVSNLCGAVLLLHYILVVCNIGKFPVMIISRDTIHITIYS